MSPIPQLQPGPTPLPGMTARLTRWRLYPLGPLARFFWVTLAAAIILEIISGLFGSGIISGLAITLSVLCYIVAIPSGIWLVGRWIKSGVLWRLRNRLIVTYLFIGAAPILLLLALALISAFFIAGQFATFLVTNDLKSELIDVVTGNKAIAAHIRGEAHGLQVSLADVPELKLSGVSGNDETIALFNGAPHAVSVVSSVKIAAPNPDIAKSGEFDLPPWLRGDFKGIVRYEGKLYFRAARTFTANQTQYTVISSEPLTSATLAKIVESFGRVQITGMGAAGVKNNGGIITVDDSDFSDQSTTPKNAKPEDRERITKEQAEKSKRDAAQSQQETISAGALPAAVGWFDTQLPFASPLLVTDWTTGEQQDDVVVKVFTRPSLLYARLFSANAIFGSRIRAALFTVAVIFGFIEIFALFIGMGLTRSITEAVYELYTATQNIERGNLRHRIRVRSNDQLAALEASFNTMSGSLERLLVEQREKERLQSELAIAQEVQEQLFPRAWTSSRYLDLFGVCVPARTVSGDYYDFLPLGATRTGIAVGDISGKGISAALLMATIQSAVRSYEFGREVAPRLLVATGAAANSSALALQPSPTTGHNPADAMWFLNRHLFQSTPPEKYATMFLGVYDGETRTLSYTNAGHLPPIIVRADGSIERLEVSGTVIGLFDEMEMRWTQDSIQLAPGDLFVAYSDGVTEPENEFGEFGDDRLIALIRQNRALPLAEIARVTIAAVQEWIGELEQPDDITVVLARPAA